MRFLSCLVCIQLLILSDAKTQGLILRGDYQKTSFTAKKIAVLPILDSIGLPGKDFFHYEDPLRPHFHSDENKEPIDFRSGIHKLFPQILNESSISTFEFLDVDYSKNIKPRKFTVERYNAYDTTYVYLPLTNHTFPDLPGSFDYVLLFYGVGFHNTENNSNVPLTGKLSFDFTIFKGIMYIHAVLWDVNKSKIAGSGRVQVSTKTKGKQMNEDELRELLVQVAAELFKKTPFEKKK